jgi:hypothetical protein
MRAAIVTTALLMIALSLGGCASLWDYSLRTLAEDDADYQRTRSSYKLLASARVKELKYPGGLMALTVSPLRKSHTVAFADWMACVQGRRQGAGAPSYSTATVRSRIFAAVVIDGCEAEPDGSTELAVPLPTNRPARNQATSFRPLRVVLNATVKIASSAHAP